MKTKKNQWSSLLQVPVLIPFVAGTVIGAAAGWYTSWHFYEKSKNDAVVQMQNADTQLRILRTLLEIFERRSEIELARDSAGNITGGRVIHLAGNAASESAATGILTVGPKPTPEKQH